LPQAPTARLNDYASLLTPAERERLEALLTERERATGTQMAIAVFRSLEGESLEDVASALFQKWRLGRKSLDNGVLLVVFVQDRKLRIEVGYGLEAALPDAVAGQIIRDAIAPRFREQRYAAGLEAAVTAVYGRIAPAAAKSPEQMQREGDEWRRRQAENERKGNLYVLLLFAFVALVIGGLAWEAAHQRGYTAGRRGWGSSGTGGWYGGGWGGGGGSSGGGFSGGGGSSGGGGASGSW
jgi:uncharacterized protein